MNQVIASEITLIKESLKQGYASSYGCLYAPSDEGVLNECKNLAARFKACNPTLFLLVGIGGSNMGVLAVLHAMKGIFYNEEGPLRFYCADTIDNDVTQNLLMVIERELTQGGIPVLCIITKSGSTTETLSNGSLFYECLKKYRPLDFQKYIVIITDEGSVAAGVAQDNGFELLTVPPVVGGRYSVFSSIGFFPLIMLGIDVESFRGGARQMLDRCLSEDNVQNKAAATALTLFDAYQAGCWIHDIFVFSPALAMLGHWYKQLIGESLGKKYNNEGSLVEVGISPTVSLGTVDLHSVVQMYLAGPRIRITTFLSMSHEPTTLKIPDNALSKVLPGMSGRSVTSIKNAISKGVLRAYKKEQRLFMDFSLTYKSSEELGEFMMMKMVETIFLARLFSINAFDQPAVELYKEEARQETLRIDKKIPTR